jgi:hypothetical protein
MQEPQPDPVAYIPLRSQAPGFAMLMIRAGGDAANLTSLIREEVRAIDPDLPIFDIKTMDQQLAQARWSFRVFGLMFAIFALIALALSAVGLYAVTAYRSRSGHRRSASGWRLSPGATGVVACRPPRPRAARLLVSDRPRGRLRCGQLLKSLLVQTSTRDPLTLTSIVLLLMLVSVLASFWPAWQCDAARSGRGAAKRVGLVELW